MAEITRPEAHGGQAGRHTVRQRYAAPRGGLGRFVRPPVLWGGASLEEAPATRSVILRDTLYRWSLAGADVLAAVVALWLATSLGTTATLEPVLLLAAPLLLIANRLAGLYGRDELVLNKTTLDEAPALLQISGLYALVVWLLHGAVVEAQLGPERVCGLWLVLFAALLGARSGARRWARAAAPAERCLVVGDPRSVTMVEHKLRGRGVKAKVVASVPLSPHADVDAVARHPERLLGLARDHDVDRVIIAPLASDAGDTLELIRIAKGTGLRVSVLPRMLEVVGSSIEFDHLEGLTMLGVRSFGLTRSSRAIKRAFDLIGVSLLLLALGPLMVLIALAIRLDTPGPILFRQTRVGRDGRRFQILKFRSMVADAETRKHELRHLNETEGLFKISQDPRVTRVGQLIRASCLDELPQLLNVWRGEMSLVGPRPLVVDEDALVAGLDRARLHLTPGMTGHWQILGSARVPLQEMVGIDYLYVANWSLWSDVKILLRTIPYVLGRGGM